MIAHGIWLGNRNEALCLCKQNQTESSSCCDHWNTLHIPITPCFRSDTEPPQKIVPVKPAWKYNCCNLWTEPIVWRPAWIQQNLLQNRDGEKGKKTQKSPQQPSWTQQSASSQSFLTETKCVAALPVPPAQGDSLCSQPPTTNATSCSDWGPPWLLHPPIHSVAVLLSLPACRAREWMWHSLCFCSTQGNDINTRKASEGHMARGLLAIQIKFLRRWEGHNASGSCLEGRWKDNTRIQEGVPDALGHSLPGLSWAANVCLNSVTFVHSICFLGVNKSQASVPNIY